MRKLIPLLLLVIVASQCALAQDSIKVSEFCNEFNKFYKEVEVDLLSLRTEGYTVDKPQTAGVDLGGMSGTLRKGLSLEASYLIWQRADDEDTWLANQAAKNYAEAFKKCLPGNIKVKHNVIGEEGWEIHEYVFYEEGDSPVLPLKRHYIISSDHDFENGFVYFQVMDAKDEKIKKPAVNGLNNIEPGQLCTEVMTLIKSMSGGVESLRGEPYMDSGNKERLRSNQKLGGRDGTFNQHMFGWNISVTYDIWQGEKGNYQDAAAMVEAYANALQSCFNGGLEMHKKVNNNDFSEIVLTEPGDNPARPKNNCFVVRSTERDGKEEMFVYFEMIEPKN